MRKRRQRSEAPASEARNESDPAQPESLEIERRTRPRRTRASYRQSNNNISAQAPAEEAPNVEESYDEIDNELTCSLCHDLFINPVAPPCGHSFCSICHLRLFSVRLPGEPGLPPSQRSRPCPLCRQKHKSQDAVPHVVLDTRARTQHPVLYSRRSKEIAAAIEQLNDAQPHYFTLTVGNNCEQSSAISTRSGISHPGRSEWQFFVELRDGITGEYVDAAVYIDQVVMHLCGGEGREVCLTPPYVVRRSSHGVTRRMCYAIVYFKPETRLQPVAVTWLLNMNPGRHCLDVPLELCRRQGENTDAGAGGPGGHQQDDDNTNADDNDSPDGGYFGHFASVTGPVVRDNAGPPGLISQEGPVSGLGSLYPVLAGLLETFIRMDNVHRGGA
ncbi:putative E3 ubiquitin-protein ligase BAH1-like 2 [Nannochloris sp. 'desiccata']|nr:putative E3 ubiquitin-protein ligase BAH1-like 2 [Chlorella desiccata (nom. nud.)]